MKLRDANLVDLPIRWQIHGLDLLTSCILQVLQHPLSLGMNKENCFALASRSTGSSDAMHIGFAVTRQVVVENVADSLHIKSTRCHIRCDNDVQLSGLQLIDNALSLGLNEVPVQSRRAETTRIQDVADRLRRGFQLDENNCCVNLLSFKDSCKNQFFLELTYNQISLTNGVRCCSFLLDCNLCWVSQMLLSDLSNRAGMVAENNAI